MDVEVLSYDPVSDQIAPRKVVNWFNNGRPSSSCTTVEVGNGRLQFAATPNHLDPHPGGLDRGRRHHRR